MFEDVSKNCRFGYARATYPRLSSNQRVLKIMKDLRGGNLEAVIFIGVIILILSLSQGASFVPNNQNPGWTLN